MRVGNSSGWGKNKKCPASKRHSRSGFSTPNERPPPAPSLSKIMYHESLGHQRLYFDKNGVSRGNLGVTMGCKGRGKCASVGMSDERGVERG